MASINLVNIIKVDDRLVLTEKTKLKSTQDFSDLLRHEYALCPLHASTFSVIFVRPWETNYLYFLKFIACFVGRALKCIDISGTTSRLHVKFCSALFSRLYVL